jgi:hypothetical protein
MPFFIALSPTRLYLFANVAFRNVLTLAFAKRCVHHAGDGKNRLAQTRS